MRRGELVGLKWSDLDRTLGRLSISRTLQNVAADHRNSPLSITEIPQGVSGVEGLV
jgi:integrase